MIPSACRNSSAWNPLSRRFATLLSFISVLIVALPIAARPPADPAPTGYAVRQDVRAFIREMADEHGFDRASLRRTFGEARYRREIVAAMDRPVLEPPKWYVYVRPFLAPERVAAGVAYWNAHPNELAQAEERYGVPADIIVAILGIETHYGKNTGKYRTIDALATLAFDYPRRAAFFRGELKQFLLLTRELGVSPLVPKGSFAGALGVPQFMPGSYRGYAVDAAGAGHADLWANSADIAASVANYLARHDWRPGGPTLLPAIIADATRGEMLHRLDGGLSERRTVEAWAADGVTFAEPQGGAPVDPVGLLLLEENAEGVEGASYWMALNNFYVLTRYNRSRLYAAAVCELAKAIKSAHGDLIR